MAASEPETGEKSHGSHTEPDVSEPIGERPAHGPDADRDPPAHPAWCSHCEAAVDPNADLRIPDDLEHRLD
jgi:hypothetical protein